MSLSWPTDVVKTRLQLQSSATSAGGRKPVGMVGVVSAWACMLFTMHPGSITHGGALHMHMPWGKAQVSRAGVSLWKLQVGTASSLMRNEGVLALWKGLPPAVARGLFYGGLRLGLYSPIKKALQEGSKPLSMVGKASVQHGFAHAFQCQMLQHALWSVGLWHCDLQVGSRRLLSLQVLAGTASGAIAAAVSSPIELIKVEDEPCSMMLHHMALPASKTSCRNQLCGSQDLRPIL
jgi:hypothetical protein